MTAIDYRQFSEILTGTAWRAGGIVMSWFGQATAELKADDSPVTAADRESDALIVAELRQLAPHIPVISEERAASHTNETGADFFLVDPLDGTREFLAGRGEFTINIALVHEGAPVFGIVYAPALSDIYVTLGPDKAAHAQLDPSAPFPGFDKIAWQPMHVRERDDANCVAVVSRSHLDDRTKAFIEEHRIADSIPGGSSIKFCLVAEGKADVYPRFGRTMEWDTAAGHAVLAAAGGTVLDEDGAPLFYGKAERGLDNPGFVAWGRAPA